MLAYLALLTLKPPATSEQVAVFYLTLLGIQTKEQACSLVYILAFSPLIFTQSAHPQTSRTISFGNFTYLLLLFSSF